MKTLVLDMCYQPIHAVSFKKAITYVVKGKVHVIESYDIIIHADWKMPAVVRLTHWVSKKVRPVPFSKRNVYLRDNGRCQYCDKPVSQEELTFDHVIPRSRGGERTWENIVTACRRCNTKKANKTPREAGLTLKKKPVQPKWLPFVNTSVLRMQEVPRQWREFLLV
jgi:5-methylcytosine-specific restriction endonuclease McrA